MRILVTGGLGFIGSNFIIHYLKNNPDDHIVNLDHYTYAARLSNIKGYIDEKRHQWICCDITDKDQVERHIKECEMVVHFAAESHVDRSIKNSSDFIKTNIQGTQVLLDAALKYAVKRFMHISTDEVYGSVADGESKENDSLLPNSPYAASKAAADLIVRSYIKTHKAPAIVTRCCNNFGPRQHPEKAIPLMITNTLKNKYFPLYGDGLNIREWVYVEDHVRAISFLMRNGVEGETYNIGGVLRATNKELISKIGEHIPVKPSPTHDRKAHDKRYAPDDSKLLNMGFKHIWNFRDGILNTIEWYKHDSRDEKTSGAKIPRADKRIWLIKAGNIRNTDGI
jgi:dTDP-glucose 4,6-dehydratase